MSVSVQQIFRRKDGMDGGGHGVGGPVLCPVQAGMSPAAAAAEPREPSTVENRTKTPCAAALRAWTTRSGMRSWWKWVIGIGQPQGLRRGEELARLVLADIG
jgi:hypothetical protein